MTRLSYVLLGIWIAAGLTGAAISLSELARADFHSASRAAGTYVMLIVALATIAAAIGATRQVRWSRSILIALISFIGIYCVIFLFGVGTGFGVGWLIGMTALLVACTHSVVMLLKKVDSE